MPFQRDHQITIVLGVCLSHSDGESDPAEIDALIEEVRGQNIDVARMREALDWVDAELRGGRSADSVLAEFGPRLSERARHDAFATFAGLLMADGILFEAEVQRLAMLKQLLRIDDRVALGAVARAAAKAAVRDGGLAFG
jgi:hypothetical protein